MAHASESQESAASGSGSSVSLNDVQMVSPALDEASGSSRQPLGQCQFDCGPPRPLSEMYRANWKALPMCRPCYNAKRALVSAAAKDPQARLALNKLQSQDNDEKLGEFVQEFFRQVRDRLAAG